MDEQVGGGAGGDREREHLLDERERDAELRESEVRWRERRVHRRELAYLGDRATWALGGAVIASLLTAFALADPGDVRLRFGDGPEQRAQRRLRDRLRAQADHAEVRARAGLSATRPAGRVAAAAPRREPVPEPRDELVLALADAEERSLYAEARSGENRAQTVERLLRRAELVASGMAHAGARAALEAEREREDFEGWSRRRGDELELSGGAELRLEALSLPGESPRDALRRLVRQELRAGAESQPR